MGVKEWFEQNFTLRQPKEAAMDEERLRMLIRALPDQSELITKLYRDGGFELIRSTFAIKNSLERMIRGPYLVGTDPRPITMSTVDLGSMIATLWPLLRHADDDWKALDHVTAVSLYLGVAIGLLRIAYGMEDKGDEEE